MSECVRGTCLAHHHATYWNLQDRAWVHADGWPCGHLVGLAGPPPGIRGRDYPAAGEPGRERDAA